MKKLTEILEIVTKSGYFKIELNGTLMSQLQILPLGSMLIENIRKEWHKNKGAVNTYFVQSNKNLPALWLNNHKNKSFNFLETSNFLENFQHVKINFQKESPLAIKEEIQFENNQSNNTGSMEGLNIHISKGTLLSCSYFFNESSASEQFFKIQRERKIWWMKFSTNPGRYTLADMKSDLYNGNKIQEVKIKSKFNFGNLDLEQIEMVPIQSLQLPNKSDFALKDIRLNKNIIPVVIRTEICLETAALAILFDAIETTKNGTISIQRKIAPYQCSIFCLAEDAEILMELKDLASHLATVVRTSGITVSNLQKCYINSKNLLKNEIKQMDTIGVPFSIILEPSSLQNGLMKLRNRDTTISEIIHITDVPQYLLKIFKP